MTLLLHRYLGWLILLPFGFLALSGIMLALSGQIERILEPKLYSVPPSSRPALEARAIQTMLERDYGATLLLAPRPGIFDTYQAEYTNPSGEVRQLWIHPLSGTVLANRPRANRLKNRLLQWHKLGYSPLAVLVSLTGGLVIISGFWIFPTRQRGKYFWHNSIMLAITPFALWQVITGILIAAGNNSATLQALHHPPIFALRFVLVVAMLSLLGALVCIGNFRSPLSRQKQR